MSTRTDLDSWSFDREYYPWLMGIWLKHPRWPGKFLTAIGSAARHANGAEYNLMRPLLALLKAKYPEFRLPPEVANSSKPESEPQ